MGAARRWWRGVRVFYGSRWQNSSFASQQLKQTVTGDDMGSVRPNVASHVISCERSPCKGCCHRFGTDGPRHFLHTSALGFLLWFSKRLVAGSLGLIQLQNERHFLLEYTKFWVNGVEPVPVQFWNCICAAHSKKAIWFWEFFLIRNNLYFPHMFSSFCSFGKGGLRTPPTFGQFKLVGKDRLKLKLRLSVDQLCL